MQYQCLQYEIERKLGGLGVLQPMVSDNNIEDISCSGLGDIFVEHKTFGGLKTNVGFQTHEELDKFVIQLAEGIKHPVTFRNPCVDATLPDGSRINIVYGTDVSKRGSNFTIRKFADFADPSDKWARFAEPQLVTVAITGPSRVTIGQAADFTINVTFKDKPYAMKDVDFVKFLIVDANSNVAFSADAKAVKDGQWTASLTADQTNKLAAGSNQFTAIVSSKVVAIPGSESFNFVTVK
jgi:hypothetical protein